MDHQREQVVLLATFALVAERFSSSLRTIRHDVEVFPSIIGLLASPDVERCDAILVDVRLSGFAVADIAELVARTMKTRPPIVLITDSAERFGVLEGLSAGADAFVVDAISSNVFECRIRALLRRTLSRGAVERTFGGVCVGIPATNTAAAGVCIADTAP